MKITDKIQISEYNVFGEIHNEGLKYIMDRSSKEVLESFVNEDGHIEEEELLEHVVNKTNQYLKEKKEFQFKNQRISLKPISIEIAKVVLENNNIGVFDLEFSTNNLNYNLKLINDKLSDFENLPAIDLNEKQVITGQVLKYSQEFWFDYFEIASSSNQNKRCDFRPNWLTIAGADANGAWGGASIGGPWGAVAFAMMMSAHNTLLQAFWQCA